MTPSPSRSATPDAFERAYAAGITRDEDLPTPVHELGRARGLAAAAVTEGGSYALGGCILTPDRMISMRDGAFVDEIRLTGGTTGQLGAMLGLEG